MSRLNDMYQSAKRHAGKIVAGAVIVGALAGVRGCVNSIGEEVYRGNINGQEVVYEEGVQAILDRNEDNFAKNRMIVRNGDITYTLIDKKDEKGIQSPDFANQQLERILIESKTGTQKYDSKKEYGENLEDQHTKNIFEKGNSLYNDLRTKIRVDIESKYKTTEEQIPK
jgi:hypothetical protein